LPAGSCPQFFPILVNDRQRVFDKLIHLGIEAIVWPGQERVPIPLDNYPQTKILNENLLLLPINHSLRQEHMEYIAESLKKITFTGMGRMN
jgi:dTDP-4-amino-4,6-dideoxygalactose transaminase